MGLGVDSLLSCQLILHLLNVYLHGLQRENDRSAVVRLHVDQHVRFHGHCRRSHFEHLCHP